MSLRSNHNHRRLGRSARGGFTIVEGVMVTVIMAILGAIALPRYGSFVAQEELEAASRRLIADLSLAQRQARRSSASQTVVFDLARSAYQLIGMKDLNHPSQLFEVRLLEEPYRARIVSASFGGLAQVVYDGFGTPSASGQVVIAVGAYQRTINIDVATGGLPKTNGPVVMVQPL